MDKFLVLNELRRLTGALAPAPGAHRDSLQSFERVVVAALLADSDVPVTGHQLAQEGLGASDEAGEALHRFAHLDALFAEPVSRPRAEASVASPLIFRRETAFRSDLVGLSMPTWSAGMAPSETFGPFIDARGRTVWFDVFRRIRLLRLAIVGSSGPSLLVPVRGLAASRRSYRIEPGSVWIASGLIAPVAALDGYYSGLRVKGGSLELSQEPSLNGDQLVINAGTTAHLHLDLDQLAAQPSPPAPEAGTDATDSTVQLPATLDLRIVGRKGSLAVGPASCEAFGVRARFEFTPSTPLWAPAIGRILVPGKTTVSGNADDVFVVESSKSSLCAFAGHATLNKDSGWLLPAAKIDPSRLGVANGTGALCIGLDAGLEADWKGLKGGATRLLRPAIIVDPDTVAVVDFFASNALGRQRWTLWKNQSNAHHSEVTLGFGPLFPLTYISSRADSEAIFFFCSQRAAFDRPLDGNGEPFEIASPRALAGLLQHHSRFDVLLSDADLFDGEAAANAFVGHPLVLRNAFFKVASPDSLLLTGELTGESSIEHGTVALTFAIARYLPTLPDPYVASYTGFAQDRAASLSFGRLRSKLAGFVKWPDPSAVGKAVAQEGPDDPAHVHFRLIDAEPPRQAAALTRFDDTPAATRDFRTLASFDRALIAIGDTPRPGLALASVTGLSAVNAVASAGPAITTEAASAVRGLATNPLLGHLAGLADAVASDQAGAPDLASSFAVNSPMASRLGSDAFLLLDVSTRADQMGVGMGPALVVEQHGDGAADLRRDGFLFGGASVATRSEPTLQILNMDVVASAANLRAVTLPQISWEPIFNFPLPVAGNPAPGDITTTPGLIVYDDDGIPTHLFSESRFPVPIAPLPVTRHFLKEFNDPHRPRNIRSLFTLPFAIEAQADFIRDVRVALPAADTQVTFNRPTFGELRGGLQIKALPRQAIDPKRQSASFPGWTLQLDNIRTAFKGDRLTGSTLGPTVMTIFNDEMFTRPTRRVPLERIDFSGYGASMFSHWCNSDAQVAGVSQAQFEVMVGRTSREVVQVRSILYPFAVHVVRTITLTRSANGYVFRSDSGWKAESGGFYDFSYTIGGPAIDPPVSIANPYRFHARPVKGVSNVREIRDFPEAGVFPSSFALNEPGTAPLTLVQWKELFDVQLMSDRLDVQLQAVVFDADVHLDDVVSQANRDPATGDFVVQSRRMIGYVQIKPGSVLIPPRVFADLLAFQKGSLGGPVDCAIDIGKSRQRMRLSRVDVTSALDTAGQPVFVTAARGSLVLPGDGSWTVAARHTDTGDIKPVPEGESVPLIKPNASVDFRIASPADAERETSGIRYGVIQSTGTQKLYFDVPHFIPGQAAMKSIGTYFADAFRLLNTKGPFPNIANAIALTSAERSVDILGEGRMQMRPRDIDLGSLLPSGYRYPIVDEPDILKIYAEYEVRDGGGGRVPGTLTLGLDSDAVELADRWKAALADMRVVVGLGPFERVMWVDGDFNAASGALPKFKRPNLQFDPVLDAVVNVLRVLQKLSGDDFDDGMDVAMTNSPDNWEYKFSATQEIPVIKFPSPLQLSLNPNPPLKLEAGLTVGFYFNEVLSLHGDPKQMVPACGAIVGFYGRIEVQCFTLGVASIYGVGQANLTLSADTKGGKAVDMKFGFGAEVVVGLPVVANVSVLYMAEVQVHLGDKALVVTGLLLFRGSAEICGGLVGIAIQIEAGGAVSWTPDATELVAQVAFTIDVCVLWVIDLEHTWHWQESRQIA
jgi:hypothetical protein